MSWVSKQLKRVHKQAKRDLRHMAEITTSGAYGGVRKNWEDIRMPLAYAGLAAATALSGGLAAGYTIPAAAGMAVAAGASGAAAGMAQREGEKTAERAAAEQERIAQQEAREQRRLAALQAGSTPDAIASLSVEARKRMQSQYKRNQVSRQNKSLGGSSSTLA